MKPIKYFALLLTLVFIFGISGCKQASNKSNAKKQSSSASSSASSPSSQNTLSSFSLPVSLSESMNPLTTGSMTNLVLWPLMFDCLAEPDENYNPVLQLAESIDNQGTAVTVHLKSVKFSDGTSLTASDVKYSYDLVKATPSSFFYSNVSNINRVSVNNSTTVVFTLNTPDALIQNVLDIPIIKNGSDVNNSNKVTNGSNIKYPPTGSGKYTFSTNYLSGTLTVNKNWSLGTSPAFSTIKLTNLPDSSSLMSSLKIGEINYLFSDYGGGAVQSAGLETKNIDLNRMVFIGVNQNRQTLSDVHVRNAISLAVDRNELVSDIFSSRACATNLPFNPDWSAVTKPSDSQKTSNFTQSSSELAAAGYTSANSNGVLTKSQNGSSLSLALNLLVNKDNSSMVTAAKKITASLGKVGIGVAIDQQSYQNYSAKLSQGNFDLYLGDILLTNNMDLTCLLAPGSSAAYGVPSEGATLKAFNSWRSGSAQIQSVVDAFNSETPFIPLCFRLGTVSYTKGLQIGVNPTSYNIFFHSESWHY